MEQTQPPQYTVEEYLALEEASQIRHEYYQGEIFAMSGGTGFHNIVKQNCVLSLRASLRGKGCRVYDENIRLAVREGQFYTYPDIMVSCHPEDSPDKTMMHHPILLLEVLSPSTENYDRVWKFNQYTRLPSLQHYLLISPTTWLVEWYRREPSGVWSYTPLSALEDVVVILELGITLPLAEVYIELDVHPLPDRPFSN